MKNTTPLLPLFDEFIKACETGKRLKKDGSLISEGSIRNYRNLLNILTKFSWQTKFELRVCDVKKLTKREFISERNYWKKFYRKFTLFLYGRGCFDNYVGTNVKHFRTFMRYLLVDKGLAIGNFYQHFYVRREDVDILVLSPEQLKFLIYDKKFEDKLTDPEKRIKDIFVFGCATALRFSDIVNLNCTNFENRQSNWYLRLKSKKTKIKSAIKLPNYAVGIYHQYQNGPKQQTLFGPISLSRFNTSIKKIGEKANFTDSISVTRERLGNPKILLKNSTQKEYRFCDKMTSHMMRRTAITTMLILGMPEHLVRNISGHSYNGTSFYRYVHYAQPYMDKEIEKVHAKLEQY